MDFNVRKKSKETTIYSSIWHAITINLLQDSFKSSCKQKEKNERKHLKIIKEISAERSDPQKKNRETRSELSKFSKVLRHAINKLHFGCNETTAQTMSSRKQHDAFQQNQQSIKWFTRSGS